MPYDGDLIRQVLANHLTREQVDQAMRAIKEAQKDRDLPPAGGEQQAARGEQRAARIASALAASGQRQAAGEADVGWVPEPVREHARVFFEEVGERFLPKNKPMKAWMLKSLEIIADIPVDEYRAAIQAHIREGLAIKGPASVRTTWQNMEISGQSTWAGAEVIT